MAPWDLFLNSFSCIVEESTIRLFADDYVIYRKIINNANMEKFQKDLDRLGEWAVENAMKINPNKSKAIRFMRARVKDPLNYLLMGTLILEARSCKYLGITLRSDLSLADQVNYTAKKAWKALHFTIRILRKGNSNTKSLAYTSDSWIWGRVLGSVQGGTNKCVRQGAKQSGQICTLYEQSELGKFGVA